MLDSIQAVVVGSRRRSGDRHRTRSLTTYRRLMTQTTPMTELAALVARVKAMPNGDEKAAMEKALGLKGVKDKPLFATHTAKGVNVETGKPYAWPQLRIRNGGKDTSGLAVKQICSNVVEFFSFVRENAEFYGVTFTPEQVAAIDLLAGQTEEE